jgi:hypothetical protein
VTQVAAHHGRWRSITVWTLVVLATLIAFASTLTLWVKRQMLDNGEWKAASAKVIADPEVRGALSVFVVNQLYANVDVAAALAQRLPPDAKPLAAPAAAALRGPAANGVDLLLQRPRVQQLWIESSARAHQRLVNVLENKTGYGIDTGNGVVTLDAGNLVTELGTEIGLPQAALDRLPPATGQIVLMRSSQLGLAQQAVQAIGVLSGWLLALVLVMYAVAVYLAHGRRRETLRSIAWAFMALGLVVLTVRKLAGNYVVDALTSPTNHDPVHRVWLISSTILGQIAWATIFYGVLLLAGVALAGSTRIARRARGAMAPVLNDRQGIAWGAAGFLFLLLVLWGGTHALRTWWGVVLIGGLFAAGLVALRRQTLEEAVIAAGAYSSADEIARLTELHDSGSISDAEFERAKDHALT